MIPLNGTAQPTDVEELKTRAEEQIRSRMYLDAVETYMKVFEATRDAKYLYNVSVLYLKTLDDPVSAWKYAVRYSDEAQTETARAHGDQLFGMVEDKLEKIRVRVEIRAKPGDADLWLDYRTPRSRLARKTLWVKPGKHSIIGEKEGHETREVPFEAVLGRKSFIEVKLTASMATLTVNSTVEGTEVFLGTERLGVAPVTRVLKPGQYFLRARAKGYRSLESEITLSAGQTRSLKAKLKSLVRKAAPVAKKPDVAPEPVVRTPIDRNWAWGTLGAGGGVAVTGVVLVVLGYLDVNKANGFEQHDFISYDHYKDAYNSRIGTARSKAYSGLALAGVGVAAVATGIALYFLSEDDSDAALLPAGPGGPGITASLRW